MKRKSLKFFVSTVLMVSISCGYAQDVIYNGKFDLSGKNYTIELRKINTNNYEIIVEDKISTPNKSGSFTTTLDVLNLFSNDFVNTFNTKIAPVPLIGAALTNLQSKSSELFFSMQVVARMMEDVTLDPVAGKINVKDRISVDYYYFDKADKKSKFETSSNKFIKIKSVQIQFENSFIENVKVLAEFEQDFEIERYENVKIKIEKGEELKFENFYPIGFSSKSNYSNLDYYLKEKNTQLDIYFKLDKLISYNQNHRLRTRDYSPRDEVIVIIPPVKDYELKKETSSKVLDVVVYSDFVGLKADKPNGLIQMEVSKEIPIHSRRYPFINTRSLNWGFLNYSKIGFTIVNIQEDKRRYEVPSLNEVINNELVRTRFISTKDLKNFNSLSIGGDLNLFLLDIPDAKSTIFIDGGFRFNVVALSDSLDILNTAGEIAKSGVIHESEVSVWEYYPEIKLQFFPEERFGINFIYRQHYLRLNKESGDLNMDIIQVAERDNFTNTGIRKESNWMRSFEINANLELSSNSVFFLRFRTNSLVGNSNEEFNQWQLGYSFDLLKTTKTK